MEKEEISSAEKRIRALTKLYYSKPLVQQALFEFALGREVVPRYFEGFGRRPDTLQYLSDVMNLILKGATSFHASEEHWRNPLDLSTELSPAQVSELRVGWDLLIDIDSLYLDYSKIAAELILNELEAQSITHYGLKFSGNKGFHIIVPYSAFPPVYEGQNTASMFPEWPRIITEYLFFQIKPHYNRRILALGVDFGAVERRTQLSKEELMHSSCPACGCSEVEKHLMVRFKCSRCGISYERPDLKTKRKLKCTTVTCPGFFEVVGEEEFSKCPKCNLSSLDKTKNVSFKKVTYAPKSAASQFVSEFKEDFASEKLGSLDLVLVSPRHLFRMPYSLHEKTALASTVIPKEKLHSFTLKDADPLAVQVMPFVHKTRENEALPLLRTALAWKRQHESQEKKVRKYEASEGFIFNPEGITEEMFPSAIKKLLKGLPEGRKRGLFILLTFLRSLNYAPEFIDSRVHEWNEKNQPPLKEGYVKSQIEWHLKQNRKILPPNYDNESFYKDLGLIDKPQEVKNPLVEVMRAIKKRSNAAQ